MAETTTAETVTRDPLAVLEEIRRRGYRNGAHGAECGRLSDAAAEDIPRLLAGYDALLKAHAPIQVYKSADACGHECPPEPDWNRSPAGDVIAAWDAYQDQHPYGTNPGGEADIRICELTPDRLACPACSKLVYETWGDDDGFVDASECVALPLLAAALSGEETPDGN